MNLLVDFPYSYALQVLKNIDRSRNRVIVVTSNSCPEYLEDLEEWQPDALLMSEFFHTGDIDGSLGRILNRVFDGMTFRFKPEFQTMLSPKERAVLRLVAQGRNNNQISKQLYVSEQTIKNRLCNIYRKLGLQSRVEAILYYWQL